MPNDTVFLVGFSNTFSFFADLWHLISGRKLCKKITVEAKIQKAILKTFHFFLKKYIF